MNNLLTLPNLLSLSRVGLALLMPFFLKSDDDVSMFIALAILVLAGISDGLDGYLARVRNQITPLGITLDPLADKFFAIVVIVGLLLYRQFPLWLAAVIIGRDLLILSGGVLLMRGRKISLPSNLTGKYAFAAIALLLAGYVIRFEFGIALTTVLTVILLFASLVGYIRVFVLIKNGKAVPATAGSRAGRIARLILILLFSSVYLYRLYTDMLSDLF